MSSDQYGQRTQDAPGTQGRQETQRPRNLQCEARAAPGGSARPRDRIIYIENSHNIKKPFVLQSITTVDELVQKLCDRFPEICVDSLGMRISTSQMGTIHRGYLTDNIPYEADSLYVSLYLKKHSPILGKIERQTSQ
jgi:hypothetical protein